MSKFSLVQESADTDLEEASDTQPDTNTAGVVEAVMEEHSAMTEADGIADRLNDNYEQVGDIKEEVELSQESALTPVAAHLLRQSLANLTGKAYAANRLPAMESLSSRQNGVEAKRIALEGIGQTLKDFWTAIKNQVNKFWNSTKQWYVKTLDGSNKLIARAKALDEKANTIQGTAKEKSFEVPGSSLIAINYQVKDANALIKGLEVLKSLLDGNLINVSKDNSSNKANGLIDSIRNSMHKARNRATAETGEKEDPIAQMDQFLSLYLKEEQGANPVKPDLTTEIPNTDEIFKQIVGSNGGQFKLIASEQASGNRRLYQVEQTSLAEGDNLLSMLKNLRVTFGPMNAKPKEMDEHAELQTLNSGQISKIADIVGSMGEEILKFKKEFEARDRYYNAMIKGLDQIAKEMEGAITQAQESADNAAPAQGATPAPAPAPAAAPAQQPTQTSAPAAAPAADTKAPEQNAAIDKYARKFVAAMSGQFRKEIALSGTLITHSMKVAAVFLTYGERSVAQYGS